MSKAIPLVIALMLFGQVARAQADVPPPVVEADAEQDAFPRISLHFAMGTRVFIAHATTGKVYHLGENGYSLMDMELGARYQVSRHWGLGLDLRPDVALGDGVFFSLQPGVTYDKGIGYFRAAMQFTVIPIQTVGLIVGGGLQFKLSDKVTYTVGLDVPIWLYSQGKAGVAFQLALLTGPRVRF